MSHRPRALLRRACRDVFSGPFAGELAQIAGRPFFGLRELGEFDEDDFFGRGFEMRALAASR